MGKFIGFLSALIFIDLIFMITGQINLNSPSSIILGAIIDPTTIKTSQFYLVIFGLAGVAGIAALAAITIGIVSRAGIDILAFAGIAFTFSLLAGDFLAIFIFLRSLNPTMAVFIMSPITIIYLATVLEWLRGKD